MNLSIELDREDDGRWIAEALELPGVMAYGETREEAIGNTERLAIEVIADRIKHGEMLPIPVFGPKIYRRPHALLGHRLGGDSRGASPRPSASSPFLGVDFPPSSSVLFSPRLRASASNTQPVWFRLRRARNDFPQEHNITRPPPPYASPDLTSSAFGSGSRPMKRR